ncbi:hypothetical protein P4B35_21515 [Pontiellaceae bacterium B12227]|nr:hypothetical protein [Pontiellaceae bacterium B12227]
MNTDIIGGRCVVIAAHATSAATKCRPPTTELEGDASSSQIPKKPLHPADPVHPVILSKIIPRSGSPQDAGGTVAVRRHLACPETGCTARILRASGTSCTAGVSPAPPGSKDWKTYTLLALLF